MSPSSAGAVISIGGNPGEQVVISRTTASTVTPELQIWLVAGFFVFLGAISAMQPFVSGESARAVAAAALRDSIPQRHFAFGSRQYRVFPWLEVDGEDEIDGRAVLADLAVLEVLDLDEAGRVVRHGVSPASRRYDDHAQRRALLDSHGRGCIPYDGRDCFPETSHSRQIPEKPTCRGCTRESYPHRKCLL